MVVADTVMLGARESVPFEFAIEFELLKSRPIFTGVLAVSVSGKGEVEIVVEVGLNAGASVQGVVLFVIGGQEFVPSANVVVELFSIVIDAFAKVTMMLSYVPAGALVFASSSSIV
jgi:hypothetical protein